MAVATTMANSFIEVSKFGTPIILIKNTGNTAVGDATVTFDKPFSSAPTVLSVAVTADAGNASGAAGDYPQVAIKSITATNMVLAWSGVFNSKIYGANILMIGQV